MANAAIAKTLNEDGVIGKQAGRIYASTVRYIVRTRFTRKLGFRSPTVSEIKR